MQGEGSKLQELGVFLDMALVHVVVEGMAVTLGAPAVVVVVQVERAHRLIVYFS